MNEPAGHADYQIGPIDIVLGVLTMPLLLFALMFVTSQQAHSLESPSSRRKLFGALLGIELLIVGIVVWAVTAR